MQKYKKFIFLTLIIATVCMALMGCQEEKKQNTIINGSQLTPIGSKETASGGNSGDGIVFRGVIISIDYNERSMIIADVDDGNKYEVTYTGGTDIKDRYGTVIAASQLKFGTIYEITSSSEGRASKVLEWTKQWQNSGITRFEIDMAANVLSIGGNEYKLAPNLVCTYNGEEIQLSEILLVDKISIYGKDKDIYSIMVEKSHGYVELTGIEAFLDGFVTVDKSAYQIELNMILPVSVDCKELVLKKGSLVATYPVSLEPGQTIKADFSKYEPETQQMGSVRFNISPSNAVLMIDGVVKDHSKMIKLEYGTHAVKIIADGYEVYSGKLVIKSEFFSQDVILDESENETTTEASQTEGYVVKINGPVGAAVYVDNVYVGIAPVSVAKKAGQSVVTLTKTGYTSKSYTIKIANVAGNVEYTFPELEVSATN